ncbi:hypothetical protein [Pseudomonas brenneri]
MWVISSLLKLLVSLPIKLFGWKFNGRDVEIGYQLVLVLYLCLIAIASMLLSYFGASFFPGKSASDAFMRSGAVVTFFGVVAKYRLDYLVMPYHVSYSEAAAKNIQFASIFDSLRGVIKWLNRLCVSVSIVGTVVWGYGDMIYECLGSFLG